MWRVQLEFPLCPLCALWLINRPRRTGIADFSTTEHTEHTEVQYTCRQHGLPVFEFLGRAGASVARPQYRGSRPFNVPTTASVNANLSPCRPASSAARRANAST